MASRTDRTTTLHEPEDAHRGFVAPAPANPAEAAADRAMADAERAVAAGSGTDLQKRLVARMGQARTQEDRRTSWTDGQR